jgi:hypothetical protein
LTGKDSSTCPPPPQRQGRGSRSARWTFQVFAPKYPVITSLTTVNEIAAACCPRKLNAVVGGGGGGVKILFIYKANIVGKAMNEEMFCPVHGKSCFKVFSFLAIKSV